MRFILIGLKSAAAWISHSVYGQQVRVFFAILFLIPQVGKFFLRRRETSGHGGRVSLGVRYTRVDISDIYTSVKICDHDRTA
jgi:hypothetical protein